MSGLISNIVVGFSQLFPDEIPKEPKHYLQNVNKEFLYKFCQSFANANPILSPFRNTTHFLRTWFSPGNDLILSKIINTCVDISKESKADVLLISPVAFLKLFEFVYSNPDLFSSTIPIDELLIEVNLFKSYILFLEKTSIPSENKMFDEVPKELKSAAIIFNQSFFSGEVINYGPGIALQTQFIKAFYLFKFLEANNDGIILLKTFCNFFQIKHWSDYLSKLFSIIQLYILRKTSEGWCDIDIPKDELYEENCFFFDRLSIMNYDRDFEPDFKNLRSNPLLKKKEGLYGVMFFPFILDKIYKSLFFKLNELNHDLKIVQNFRSFYTSNFSEKVLFKTVIEYLFERTPSKKISGERLLESYDTACDYYIRDGNNIFLFENKDIFINSSVKESLNYHSLEFEIKKKLYQDDSHKKPKPKAIMQLINNIKIVLSNQNKLDNLQNPNSLKIYPVIVLHDSSFDSPGLNFILKQWFQSELKQLNSRNLNIAKVRPLTVINIDTLIYYSDHFREKRIRLNQSLDLYINYTSKGSKKSFINEEHFKKLLTQSFLPFSTFLAIYLEQYKNDDCKLFDTTIEKIITVSKS